MTPERHRLICCVLPLGVAMPLMATLKREKNIDTANVNNARGVGKLTAAAYRRLGDHTEKQFLTVVVAEDQADALFEFIYHEAKINRPHGGLMYMCGLHAATPFALPDLPEQE